MVKESKEGTSVARIAVQNMKIKSHKINVTVNSFLFLPRQWRPFHISTVDRRHAAEAMKTLAPEKNRNRN